MTPRLAWIAGLLLVPAIATADEPPPSPEQEPAPPSQPAPASEPPPQDVVEEPEHAVGHPTARADLAGLALETGSQSDVRSYAKDWLVAPPGYQIGGELRFITASTSPDGPKVKFTDLALLDLNTRWTAGRRIQLAGGISLLAKQPDSRKDFFLQGGNVGLKIATSRRTAIAAGIAGGPTMSRGPMPIDDGFWGSVATGVIHRSRIEQFLAFQYGGGATATGLRIGDADPVWQAGLGATSELVFHTPRGEWAMWFGFDLELPVVHSDALDPRSRLGVTVGTVFSAVKDWDLYASFSWRDRGTTELPATTLPIVDGGFDQRQVSIGLTRRFSVRGKSSKWALAL